MFKLQNSNRDRSRHLRGFTLIELLVVIGLISVLVAGIGLSMRQGDPTSALRAGQNTLVGLMSAARGQAALNQTDAMIVVDVTNVNNDEFLRSLQVVVLTGAPNFWRPVGDPILLPQGVYVVPPASATATGLVMTGDWTTRRSAGFISGTSGDIEERPVDANYTVPKTNAFASRKYLRFQKFNAFGTTGASGMLLVTSGRRSGAAEVTLDNPEFIRGLRLSKYGVPTFLNETVSMDKVTTP